MVGDDGLLRNVLQRQALFFGERMVGREDDDVLPLVAGQGDQFGVVGQRFGGNADFGHFVDQHAGHLVGRALVQADIHLGVGLAQLGHRHRQHVARLGVGGGDRQGATVLRAELFADALQVTHLAHDDFDAAEHVLAGFGDAFEALAVAGKNLYAQLFFQFDDGFGHARLRGVQRFGGLGQVQATPGGFLDEAELV